MGVMTAEETINKIFLERKFKESLIIRISDRKLWVWAEENKIIIIMVILFLIQPFISLKGNDKRILADNNLRKFLHIEIKCKW